MASINLINALQYAENCDNISLEVLETIENMKIERVKQIHGFLVTPPKDGISNGRWQTCVKREEGRKKVTSTTERGLYKKLIDFYSLQQYTLRVLYPQWIEKREMENVSDRSIKRNEQHWAKYYLPHTIIDIPLNKLNVDNIEKFLYEVIKDYEITAKELGNMKFILTDMMKMAKRKGYIMINPCTELEIKTYRCKPIGKVKNTSRVYLPHERELLFSVMKDELEKNPNNTDIYAVLLLFRWGLRIGEICALSWDSVNLFEKEIHIHAMETLKKDCNGNLRPVVVQYTKKKSPYGDRYLPLDNSDIEILKTIRAINDANGNKESEYIFCDIEGRTKIREIDNCIRKMCGRAGIEVKSAHDIRRTVASELYANGVSAELIREYMVKDHLRLHLK